MTTIIIAMLLAPIIQAPAIELAEPSWAFIVPAEQEAEPTPPVDPFLAKLDQAFVDSLDADFAPIGPFDPFEPEPETVAPQPATMDEIREGEAAAALSTLEAELEAIGRQ